MRLLTNVAHARDIRYAPGNVRTGYLFFNRLLSGWE